MKKETILMIIGGIVVIALIVWAYKKFMKPQSSNIEAAPTESKGTPPPVQLGAGFEAGESFRQNGVVWTWSGSTWY